MGMYASVRGWLQVDHKQREAAESLIAAAHHDLYSGGWGFPSRPFNWPLYVFYGGDPREGYLPWLREQVSGLAALPPVDDDGDMPAGLFVISDERAAVYVWEVRDGMVHERPSPELAWVLRPLATASPGPIRFAITSISTMSGCSSGEAPCCRAAVRCQEGSGVQSCWTITRSLMTLLAWSRT
jgi:hypothetical protein